MEQEIYKDLNLERFNEFASSFASKLQGGEIIVLSSDLGGGKTTFTKALVKELGYSENVTSPTFTIVNEYKAKFDIFHYDFYRLTEPGIMANELVENSNDKNNIVIIEWADIVSSILPKNYIEIIINKTKEDNRDIIINRH